MKIFIVYVSCGAGHKKSAEAFYNYYSKRYPQDDVRIIDILGMGNKLFRRAYVSGYLFLVNHCCWLWGFIFWLTNHRILQLFYSFFGLLMERINLCAFTRFLIKEQPEIIISTHFLPPGIAGYLKREKKINSKLITIITDFGVHLFWLREQTSLYIAASGVTRQKLISFGIPVSIIKELGIPVLEIFLKAYNKEELCRKFSIEAHKFTLLIMTGSFGIGPIEKIVDFLHIEAQIIVVCANNKELYRRLKRKNYFGVLVFGFVDFVDELMSVSDAIITKPGGLSIAESLIKELPPVFISPIPGQEAENVRILKEYGIGIEAKSLEDIKRAIFTYRDNPQEINTQKALIRKIKKPFVLEELCNVIR